MRFHRRSYSSNDILRFLKEIRNGRERETEMATAFRINEDIENVLEVGQKKDHQQKTVVVNNSKAENKFDKQPLRPNFANLNNVTNDSGRNIAAPTTHAQKTVRKQQLLCK